MTTTTLLLITLLGIAVLAGVLHLDRETTLAAMTPRDSEIFTHRLGAT